MRVLIVALLAICLMMVGCGDNTTPVENIPMPVENTPAPEVDTPMPVETEDAKSPKNITPYDSVGIEPGKYLIEGLSAGKEADFVLNIHNGSDTDRMFTVAYKLPTREKDGFVALPESKAWVDIPQNEVCVTAGMYETLTLNVSIPDGVETPDKWEFWISTYDTTQSGMVDTELCQRILVSTVKT